ncbi:MAG: hypothetical protein JNL52_00405 [Flavobacteriales bacterium]|nr:hypothetical protein [Flavobacteriales bacterium]
MKRTLQIVFGTGVVIGVLNMVVGWAVTFGLISWSGELPWFGVQGVQCHEGHVYVGLEYFSSVLVYNEQGVHVRTIPVPTHGKPYLFSVQDDGSVHASLSHAPRYRAGDYRIGTERLERYLEFHCGEKDPRTLRQSVLWLLVAGPLPGGLLGFFSILGLLVTTPNLLVFLFERSK